MNGLISIHAVAERLGVSLRTIQNYVKDGRLVPTLQGRPSWFNEKDIEGFELPTRGRPKKKKDKP